MLTRAIIITLFWNQRGVFAHLALLGVFFHVRLVFVLDKYTYSKVYSKDLRILKKLRKFSYYLLSIFF